MKTEWMFSKGETFAIVAVFAVLLILMGCVAGVGLTYKVEAEKMGGYDLYNCIANNAEKNDLPKHPAMIEKIQRECVCFKEKAYDGQRIMEEGC